MRVAICGYPPLALQVQESLKNSDIEFKFFIRDFVPFRGAEEDNLSTNLPQINFFEFRWLVNKGELDGIIIADKARSDFTKACVQTCKLYGISKIGIADFININPFNPVYMLDPSKIYVGYLETNIADACNLNCRGCTHFSGLFERDEIYPLENFRRDVSKLSQTCDIVRFRLLGGEPLLLKNIDEYIKISRQYLPKTNLRLVTNGLLIPSLSQKVLDAIRKNNCIVDISSYKITVQIIDKVKNILTSNNILFQLNDFVKDKFGVFLTLHSGNNPEKSRAVCFNNECRFLRDGKIYKCPIDALNYKFTEKFGIENFPAATAVDIYTPNFSALLEHLNGNVEMCYWCSEKCRKIDWEPTNNPKLEDWLAAPDELQNFQ